MKWIVALVFTLVIPAISSAGELAFVVHTSRKITDSVDRFYGSDGGAFATIFCQGEAKQVLMVDSRMRELDGKSFHFTTLEACNAARVQSRRSAGCKAELLINTDDGTAGFRLSRCN